MKLCIARSKKSTYSETFIRNQIRGLSDRADVVTIHSGRLPERKEDGQLLSPLPFWILHKLVRAFTGKRNNYFSHFGLKRFLSREKVDVVLANYGLTGVHMVPVCRSLGIPLVTIFHGFDATQKKVLDTYGDAYREMFSYNAAIIAVSNEMKTRLVALGAPAIKVNVIPYGIDTSLFMPGNNKSAHPLLLAVGRFAKKKAPVQTIEAFRMVTKAFPEAQLVMIGEKSGLYEDCVRAVSELGLAEQVIFTGVLSPHDIADYMKKAWVFVQHSVTPVTGDMEGTPNSVLEAAASGLPVVSTFHGGIRDAVVHEETGYLVPEMDVEGMASYVIKLLKDTALRARMGTAGRDHILANYEFGTQMNKMAALLESVARKQAEPL